MPETIYLPELRDQLRVAATAAVEQRRHRARWRPRAIGGTVLAAAVAAAIAFVIGAGSDPQATASSVRSDGTLLSAHFQVFARAPQADDADNPFATTATTRLIDPLAENAQVEVDPDSVHRLPVPGQHVWVAATSRKVCMAASSQAEAGVTRVVCARPAQILDDGLFLWGSPMTFRSGVRAEITGLLPDGVRRVTFLLADGQSVDAEVTDNGVAASLPSQPTRVRFRDRDNALHSAHL